MPVTAEAAARAALADVKVGDWVWHLHHGVLCELLTEPAANRIDYIVSSKPKKGQATRLRLIRAIRGELPEALVKAGAAYVKAQDAYAKAQDAYDKAWAAYDKAWVAYVKARAAYVKARAAYDKAREAYDKAWAATGKAQDAAQPALTALHAIECPKCPWDGRTIFPKENR